MSEYKAKKATFLVVGTGKNRAFTAVNNRAKAIAKKLGKRSKLSYAELKSTVGKGSYTFHAYQSDKSLKPIRF